MKKYLVIVAVLVSIGIQAQPITEQQAFDRALKFLSDKTQAQGQRAQARNSELKAAKVEARSIYAFNLENISLPQATAVHYPYWVTVRLAA